MLCGDLHSHTTWSDGTSSPGERVIAAMKAGNTLMAITDHDTIIGSLAGIKFIKDFDLPILSIPAVEFSSDRGHILLYGLKDNPFEGASGTPFEKIRKLANEENALLIFAHPDWAPNKVAWESGEIHNQRLAGDYDAFEIINMVEDYSGLMEYYKQHGPFPIVCASDSHHLPHISTATLWVDCSNDQESCINAIKNGKTAVYASPELAGRKEPKFEKELWMGDEKVIAKAKTLQRNKQLDEFGIQINFEEKTAFPNDTINLNISCKQKCTVEIKIPAADINKSINLNPETIWKKSFTIDEKLCDDYCYAVVKHNDGWELADCQILNPIDCRHSVEGLRLFNKSPFPVNSDKLDTPLLPQETAIVNCNNNKKHILMPIFSSWDNLTHTAIEIDCNNAEASHAWAWDKNCLYGEIIVEKPIHCQPYERKGLWDGDCIRLSILPGSANPRHPIKINPILIDGALTPEGVKVSFYYKQFDGKHNNSKLSVTRNKNKTIYRFEIGWTELKMAPPKAGDIIFCIGQIHIHGGEKFQGFYPFIKGSNITSSPEKWDWLLAGE